MREKEVVKGPLADSVESYKEPGERRNERHRLDSVICDQKLTVAVDGPSKFLVVWLRNVYEVQEVKNFAYV